MSFKKRKKKNFTLIRIYNFILIVFRAQRVKSSKAKFIVSFAVIDFAWHIRTVIIHNNA